MLRRCSTVICAGRHRVVRRHRDHAVGQLARGPAAGPGRCRARRWTSATCEANSIDTWATSGQPPGAVVHPQQPLPADRALRGRDPGLVDEVARGDPGPAGQRVVGRCTRTSATSWATTVEARCSGTASGTSPQLCTSADVDVAGRDQVDGVPRLALGDGQRQRGARRAGGARTGATRPRTAVEKAASRRWPATVPRGRGAARPRSARGRRAAGRRRRRAAARAGQHHPAADALEQRHPDLALEPLDLLGDRAGGEAEHLGGGDHRAVACRRHGARPGRRDRSCSDATMNSARSFAGASRSMPARTGRHDPP